MQNDKLLPCPFCGVEAKLYRFPRCERKYVVICQNENCMASVGVYSVTKEVAIKNWNTRKPMERIVEQLEEVSFERYGNEGMGGELVVNFDDAIEIVKGGVDNAG